MVPRFLLMSPAGRVFLSDDDAEPKPTPPPTPQPSDPPGPPPCPGEGERRSPRRHQGGHMLPVTMALVASLMGAGLSIVKRPAVRAAIAAIHGHAGQPCTGQHRR